MTNPYTNKTRPKPSAKPPKNDRDEGKKAHAMTCVLDREPIQIADLLSPGDNGTGSSRHARNLSKPVLTSGQVFSIRPRFP
jgi:hypothetical protein